MRGNAEVQGWGGGRGGNIGTQIGRGTRFEVVRGLNEGQLDGIVISAIGGCGHNLVGANHVLFMGSMYS